MYSARDVVRNIISSSRDATVAGSSLLYAIIALTTLSAIAAAAATLVSTNSQTAVTSADALRARYLALSGLNLWNPDTTGSFSLGNDIILLAQTGPDAAGGYAVTSTGVVRPGTSGETRSTITATRGGSGVTITFKDDIDSFKTPVVGQTGNSAGAGQVYGTNADANAPATLTVSEWTSLWTQNVSRYADGWVRLGGGEAQTTGAVWYTGTKGACKDGSCALGTGFRAYLRFAFSDYDDDPQSKGSGDGFTFTLATAANDSATAAGGAASGGSGEYLGYAGPGPSGKGITPPKMAVEIDTYPNRGYGPPQNANSRRDGSNANHVAVVYWGETATSYDDNVHGLGSLPQNPPSTATGYAEKAVAHGKPQWLEDGEDHALRMELQRSEVHGGNVYTVKVWIDPAAAGKDDVSVDYAAETPLVVSSVSLKATDHAGLAAVRFGFTEATSVGISQDVAIHDFALRFRE